MKVYLIFSYTHHSANSKSNRTRLTALKKKINKEILKTTKVPVPPDSRSIISTSLLSIINMRDHVYNLVYYNKKENTLNIQNRGSIQTLIEGHLVVEPYNIYMIEGSVFMSRQLSRSSTEEEKEETTCLVPLGISYRRWESVWGMQYSYVGSNYFLQDSKKKMVILNEKGVVYVVNVHQLVKDYSKYKGGVLKTILDYYFTIGLGGYEVRNVEKHNDEYMYCLSCDTKGGWVLLRVEKYSTKIPTYATEPIKMKTTNLNNRDVSLYLMKLAHKKNRLPNDKDMSKPKSTNTTDSSLINDSRKNGDTVIKVIYILGRYKQKKNYPNSDKTFIIQYSKDLNYSCYHLLEDPSSREGNINQSDSLVNSILVFEYDSIHILLCVSRTYLFLCRSTKFRLTTIHRHRNTLEVLYIHPESILGTDTLFLNQRKDMSILHII